MTQPQEDATPVDLAQLSKTDLEHYRLRLYLLIQSLRRQAKGREFEYRLNLRAMDVALACVDAEIARR